MMINIGILTGCDSEKHLSKPIYNKLKEIGLNPIYIKLAQNDIVLSYKKAEFQFISTKYDFVLVVADRPEQMGGVLAAFDYRIPIGHIYAGDHNIVMNFDDIHRHAISLYSNIQFCSCSESAHNTINLMRSAGLVPNVNIVGATHFDIINLDKIKSTIYKYIADYKPYILIAINSETLGNDSKLIKDTVDTLLKIHSISQNVIIAEGNGDSKLIEIEILNKLIEHNINNIYVKKRMGQKYFLSLITNCDYFITNSSSANYEAPALIDSDKIIHIGNRNKNRTIVPKEAHDGMASTRVANLIKVFLEETR